MRLTMAFCVETNEQEKDTLYNARGQTDEFCLVRIEIAAAPESTGTKRISTMKIVPVLDNTMAGKDTTLIVDNWNGTPNGTKVSS